MSKGISIIAISVTALLVGAGVLFMGKCMGGELKNRGPGTIKAASLPGAEKLGDDLLKKFEEMQKKRGGDYKPRTKHLNPDGTAIFTNRLFLESSPYLLQHAHNPVNWYPWGDEAFEAAKKRKVPVLLSVGYSTCHWCHVMEEESFEDKEIAQKINENYVAIKIDREERPDVDAIYMAAVQAMTGGGGWPMTVWLTPDRKPFYGGTYFPARDWDRGAPTGFLTLLTRLKKAYDSEPAKVVEAAQQMTEAIKKNLSSPAGSKLPEADALKNSIKYYESNFDSTHGGLSRAPKFPSSLPIRFLFRYYRRATNFPELQKKALKMATLTLNKMAAGGMYDQVGGGFHRYSTDAKWLVPHFEKMLYDNALLAMAYLDGYQVTHDENYARVVKEILRYAERDMGSPEGAFYSATDADSLGPSGNRNEGYFFTWTKKEIQNALDTDHAKAALEYYSVSSGGNFEGRNILHVPKSLHDVARKLNLPEVRLAKLLEEAKDKLYLERAKRAGPLRDEKIQTSWNGLMISAFAKAGTVLDQPQYVERAEKAAGFILKNLYRDHRLLHVYKDGQAKLDAFLDDYAFFTASLLDLFEATGDAKWFEAAKALDEHLEKNFEDKTAGGFFMTSGDHESLLAREKPGYDGAEPTGNSVALMNILRLHELTTDDHYRQRAERALKFFSPTLTQAPAALSEMLLALDFHLDKPKAVVIINPKSKGEADSFLKQLREYYLPNRVLVVTEQNKVRSLEKAIPLLQGKVAMNGKTTAYVCENGICQYPTGDPKVFRDQITLKNTNGKRP